MKQISIFFLIFFVLTSKVLSDNQIEFEKWKKQFKLTAITNNISEDTFDLVMSNVRFLPKVIEYDRYQPEFYEDTFTYISKRANKKRVSKGLNLYNKQQLIINDIEKKFSIEKELLLALMGIETNYGKYLGKMDIIFLLPLLVTIKDEVIFLQMNF